LENSPKYHITVMGDEAVEHLVGNKDGVYIDCTFGEGGHSLRILQECEGHNCTVIGIDKDIQILQWAESRLEKYKDKIKLFRANYMDMDLLIRGLGIKKVDGILMDLGVSSYQLDYEDRGFSLKKDGPLDMRMDVDNEYSAHEVVNEMDQIELERIIREYGEERFARSISRKIVESRPINTTLELVQAIRKGFPSKVVYNMKKHYATRTFQAIRIFVNKELEELENGLAKSLQILKPGGKIVVISFHSLEDRIVKHFMKNNGELKVITKKPLIPGESELKANPRSRSAKLRVAEKI